MHRRQPVTGEAQKGAGARKAAALDDLALERLRGARAAALRNKTCVTEIGGEQLYYTAALLPRSWVSTNHDNTVIGVRPLPRSRSGVEHRSSRCCSRKKGC